MAIHKLVIIAAISAILFPSVSFAGTAPSKSPPPAFGGHTGPYSGLKYAGDVGGTPPGKKCKGKHCQKKSTSSKKSPH